MDHAIGTSIKKRVCSPDAIKNTVFQFAYWFFLLLFLEATLHVSVYGSIGEKFSYIIGYSAVFAAVLALAVSVLSGQWQFLLTLALALVLTVLYGSQIVYNLIFGTLYSASQMQMGGTALTSFWAQTVSTIGENLGAILLLLIPTIVLVILRVFAKGLFTRSNCFYRILLIILALTANMTVVHSIEAAGTGYFTDYYYFHAKDANITQTAQRFGLLTAFRLDMFGPEETMPEPTEAPTELSTCPPAETVPDEKPVEYNVYEFDFDELNGKTTDETILAINNYVSTLTGTNKNEYTGMLKDYNLILVCAESFATGAIHPEVTPTLYRLANEGIIFNNFYNSFPNTTTDGEYSLLFGLYPDGTRGKNGNSFYSARKSYIPFAPGKVFSEQAGIQPYGYHNYEGSYYGRDETHPNLGYQMKFSHAGMTFTTDWINSDLEMMEQSVDDYIGQDLFHAYYMTFSGHYKYNLDVNPMSKRNWNVVKDLEGYSRGPLAYLSCHVELDKAMAYLMQRLEEEGVADRTAIVLVGDHFPYGLKDYDYSELVGYEIDNFSKYKSTLIFWVGGLEENIIVDEYCCNVDILPTILNLWGFEYDSRMLAGTDVFSDNLHVAVRVDKSFYTDKVWLDANTGEIRYLVDPSEIPEGYVDQIIKLIQDRMDMSVNILNSAYYNYIFDQGEVKVSRDYWRNKPQKKAPADAAPNP